MASFSKGTVAARPAASQAAATFWWATDAQELSFSDGSVWIVPTEGPLTSQIAVGPQGPPGTTDWAGILNKPSAFAPLPHQHAASDITGLPAGSADSISRKTSDQPSTATALANTTEMFFPVAQGAVYRFTAFIVYRTAALTTGIRLGATVPAFSVYSATVRIPGFAIDGVGAEFQGSLTTSGDSVLTTAVAAANTDFLAVIEGLLVPSANGNFQVQHATEVAGSAATVRTGSHITYRAL